jgi:DNA-binding FadR family transcriptional regulator
VKVRQDLSVLRALEQRSVVDEVKEQILELIREGEYRPGDRLPSEKDFAEVLRVSRTSVRQALASVATYGMIESKPGLGYFVCEISPGSVFNIVLVPSLLADETLKYLQEVRSIIEVEAISLAVDRPRSPRLYPRVDENRAQLRCTRAQVPHSGCSISAQSCVGQLIWRDR